jgi:hypothetical protein
MQTHVKVLGILFIVLSGLGLMVALGMMLAFGAAAGIVGASAQPHDAAIALPIIGLAGSALVAFLLVLSLPGLIVGIGLLKFSPWARIAGIVLSALHLIHIPFGTALGIYGLWVLLNKETEPLFQPSIAVARHP